jgi:hypothetical protein
MKRKRRRPYRHSGFHALVAATKRDGVSAMDGRSTTARALKLWKTQVAADLGDDLSAQQRTLLDVAAVDMALLSVADAFLRENAGQLVNRKRKTFVPLVAERLRVATHLADVLRTLGIARVPKPSKSLAEILAGPATRIESYGVSQVTHWPQTGLRPFGGMRRNRFRRSVTVFGSH